MDARAETTPAAPGRSRAGAVALMLLVLGVLLLLVGSALGLGWAPPERWMGDVTRILYIHVPTAWSSLVALTVAAGAALGFLFTRRWIFDAVHEASAEVGVLLGFLLCVQGSLWARPTWGVWWDWDPRLTTVAVMLFAFLGVLALRRFVEDPVRRAVWSAVATLLAFADVPIVYFSVRWWNSLHQMQSSPATMDGSMVLPLRINAFGMLFLASAFIVLRSRLATHRLRAELAPPPPEPLANPVQLSGGRP